MTKTELEAAISGIESAHSGDVRIDESRRALYELQIHQIELEMQNRELMETQTQLHEALSRYSDLYDFAPVGYLTLDDTGQVKEINLTGAAMLGIERLHLTGQYFTRLLAKSDVHKFREHLHKCKTSQERVLSEISLLLNDDNEVTVELTSVCVMENDKAMGLYRTSMIDITDRRQARKIAAREQIFSDLLISSSGDGIFVLDRECTFTRWNPGMERIFGISKAQAMGKCAYDILPFLKQMGEDKCFNEALSGKVVASNFRPYVQTDTPGQRYFEAQYSPLFESEGVVVGVIAVIRDVTERHEIRDRINQLNSDLHRKNHDLETIISVATHDIRAPLVNVQGFSKELGKDFESLKTLLGNVNLTDMQKNEAARLFEYLKTSIGFVQNSATAVDILLTNLLTVTKAGLTPLTLKKVDMNSVFTELMRNLEYKFKQAEATISIGQLPACNADEDQIKQVFSNIVDNAVKYLDPAWPGHINVSGSTQGDSAIYCIEDNGVGIPEQKKEKVFEFFLRLDGNAAKGEGFGLAIVRRIVEKHRGRVWVESEVGKGSKFYVALPLLS